MNAPIWITKAGSLGIIPDEEFYQFILDVYDPTDTPQPVTGTLTFDSTISPPGTEFPNNPRRVVGVGTSFTTELDVGDRLISEFDIVLGIIGQIISDTELLLFQNSAFTASNISVRSMNKITFKVVSGNLPVGLHLDQFGNMSGIPINGEIEGVPAPISAVTTSTFTIRATNRANKLSDRTFSLTVAGVNPITISPSSATLGTCFDGDLFNYPLKVYNAKPASTIVWSVDPYMLPPGLTLTTDGIIRGYVTPTQGIITEPSVTYTFKVSVTDGFTINTANYSIVVYNRGAIAPNPIYKPALRNYNDSMDPATQGNYYTYQLIGEDFNGDALTYMVSPNSVDQLPPGLSLSAETGWITGTVAYGPLTITKYNITFRVAKAAPDLAEYYREKPFTIEVLSQAANSIVWVSATNLGTINNGDISSLSVIAKAMSGQPLQYKITAGSLPAGLNLTNDGLIVGRVGFEATRIIDIDENTNDFIGVAKFSDGTTFDQTHRFTVETYSSDLLIVDRNDFYIRVATTNIVPYENLYIRAFPTRIQRYVYNQLINNTDIFPPSAIYRSNDPWFGRNLDLRSLFLTGLAPAEARYYVDTMTKNHYKKTLTYGSVRTARALDENFKVKYEVVYIELIDDSTNERGQSAPMDIKLPKNTAGITDVYTNSFENMRNRIVESPNIGYVNRSILPEWMTSRQVDGRVLGFTRALVLAYTNPGLSSEIAYRINQEMDMLRLVGFTVDRYEWDNYLSDGYDKVAGSYIPGAHTSYSSLADTGWDYLKFPDVPISTNLTS